MYTLIDTPNALVCHAQILRNTIVKYIGIKRWAAAQEATDGTAGAPRNKYCPARCQGAHGGKPPVIGSEAPEHDCNRFRPEV